MTTADSPGFDRVALPDHVKSACLRCRRCAACHAPNGDCPPEGSTCSTGRCPNFGDFVAVLVEVDRLTAENTAMREAITDALHCLEFIADTRPAVAALRRALSGVGTEGKPL